MKQIIFTLTLFLSSSCLSQDWREDKENLKGFVKEVYYNSILLNGANSWKDECVYEYNQNGFLTRERLTNTMSEIGSSTFRVYNEDQTHCLEEYFVYENDTAFKSIFQYDSLGNTKKVIHYNHGKHWSTYYHFYNKKGILKESFQVIENGNDTIRYVYEFDRKHRKIKETCFLYSYSINKTWTYNKYGNLIEEKCELKKYLISVKNENETRKRKVLDQIADDTRCYINIFEYNKLNQKIHEIRKSTEGEIWSDIIFEYNLNRDIDAEYHLNLKNENGIRDKKSFKYEYDSIGNWVMKTSISIGQIYQEEKREIEYY